MTMAKEGSSRSKPGRCMKILLCTCALVHVTAGVAAIVLQVMLIMASSPFHNVSAGLWTGPVFFVQGILGLVTMCESMLCSVMAFLISSVAGSLFTVALMSVAAIDLGAILKCPTYSDPHHIPPFVPPYCVRPSSDQITQASVGLIIAGFVQLVASCFSLYFCCKLVYSGEITPQTLSRPNSVMLYEPVPFSERNGRGSFSQSDYPTRVMGHGYPLSYANRSNRRPTDMDRDASVPLRSSTRSIDRDPDPYKRHSRAPMAQPEGSTYSLRSTAVASNNFTRGSVGTIEPISRCASAVSVSGWSARSSTVYGDLPPVVRHTAV